MAEEVEKVCQARDCMNSFVAVKDVGIEPASYCSPACSRREAKHRKRARAGRPVPPKTTASGSSRKPAVPRKFEKRNLGSSMNLVGRCPRPYKQVFRTEEEAQTEIDRIGDDTLNTYVCSCSALHIGHPSPRWQKAQAAQAVG